MLERPTNPDPERGQVNNAASLSLNEKIATSAAILDMLDLTVIFVFFVKQYWHELLEKTGRFVLFPTAALLTGAQAFLAWRQVKLEDGWKSGSIVRAIVDTLGAIAVNFAVGGALLGLLTIAAPIIFAVTFGLKTLYQGAAAYHNLRKSFATSDPDDTERFRNRAINFAMGTLIGILATAAIITVMIFELNDFAAFGIAAGVIGASYAGYNLLCGKKSHAAAKYTLLENDEEAPEPNENPAETLKENKPEFGLDADKPGYGLLQDVGVATTTNPSRRSLGVTSAAQKQITPIARRSLGASPAAQQQAQAAAPTDKIVIPSKIVGSYKNNGIFGQPPAEASHSAAAKQTANLAPRKNSQ